MDYLCCSPSKASNVLRELIVHNLLELQQVENRGKMYLKRLTAMETDSSSCYFQPPHNPSYSFLMLPRELPNSLYASARILYAYIADTLSRGANQAVKMHKSTLGKILGVVYRTIAKWVASLFEYGLLVHAATTTIDREAIASISGVATPKKKEAPPGREEGTP